MRRLGGLAAAAAGIALAMPAAAGAHAILQESQPSRAATLGRAPEEVVLRFNEAVEAGFGSVRVYDRDGNRVDEGELIRPAGSDSVGVAVQPDLDDGIYTATYRVISADSHPVSGGYTFTVGDSGGSENVGVAELIDAESPGAGLQTALAVVRFAAYLATAALLGGLVFLLWVWAPALAAGARPGPSWQAAGAAFARRLRRVFAWALGIAAASTAAGIVIQGAIAMGAGLADGLRPEVIEEVLGTDFGTAWSLRLAAVVLLAGLLLARRIGLRYEPLTPVELGATGVAVREPLPRSRLAVIALGLAGGYLALAPGLGGHPGVMDPRWLSLAASFAHVLAFAIWAGGLGILAFAVPAATRELAGSAKTELLAATVSRFSALALGAVAVLLATGVIQSVLQLEALADLWETGYGRAILVKAGLLSALIGIAAYNRSRLRPELARLAASEELPGPPGRILARALRAELVLVGGVLAATAVLTALSPAAPQQGPYATSATVGSARLEVTVDPATVGRNEIHVYLFDSRTGAQYRDVRELRLAATLPDERIGPIRLNERPSGPGHYVVRDADLGVSGDWELAFDVRVSAFEQHSATVEVPIR